MIRVWLGCFVGILLFSNPADAQIAAPSKTELSKSELSNNVDLQVRQLIQELGSDSFATRTRAQQLLQQYGLDAFEQLQQAQTNPDIEIEMAAKYLVSSLMISWSKESDPAQVREFLHEYGSQIESVRLKRIGMLEFLPNRLGLAALVRLVRYEKSDKLSREAALSVLRQVASDDDQTRKQNAAVIRQGASQSIRKQAGWLLTYADDLQNQSFSDAKWQAIVIDQRELLDSRSAEITPGSVLELVRTCAGFAVRHGHREQAIALATEHLDLLEPSTRNLTDACTWALTHDLHEFVLAVRKEFTYLFDKQPGLLYSAAEALHVRGKLDEAEELAEKAIGINAFPTGEAAEKISPRDLSDLAERHNYVARELLQRGLFQWAFREYELVIENTDMKSAPNWTARSQLADSYKSHLMHDDVIRIIEPLVQRLSKDQEFQDEIANMFGGSETLPYFQKLLDNSRAQQAIENQKLDKARELLLKAYTADKNDIDILIQMYRTDGDQEWRTEVMDLLQEATKKLASEVVTARQQRQLQGGMRFGIGEPLNNYAWLISNTEGDYKLALKYSLESLEEGRDGARLDTCARCYFALKDYDMAIATQKEAIKEMPNVPELTRQLEEFEKAAAAASNP